MIVILHIINNMMNNICMLQILMSIVLVKERKVYLISSKYQSFAPVMFVISLFLVLFWLTSHPSGFLYLKPKSSYKSSYFRSVIFSVRWGIKKIGSMNESIDTLFIVGTPFLKCDFKKLSSGKSFICNSEQHNEVFKMEYNEHVNSFSRF